MAGIGGSQSDAFGAGINHLANPGRMNAGSITLDGGLQADSDRWASLTPGGVLSAAHNTGTPADTDAGIEFGQQALGNADDAEQAAQSWDRALMTRAASIGTDDGTP